MERRAALAAILASVFAPAARSADDIKRIGYLSGGGEPTELAKHLESFGWVHGKNLQFEVRKAKPGSPPQVASAAAAELARAKVDVLVGFLDRSDILAAATKTIPIVAAFHPDPAGLGLAKSLRQPGGNVTGLTSGAPEAASAWLGLLHKMRPKLARVVVVHGERGEKRIRAVTRAWPEAAAPLGVTITHAACFTIADVERAFDALGDPETGAAYLMFGGMNGVALRGAIQKDVHALAIRRRIATVGNARLGALMSYELSFTDPMRRLAAIVDKVLRGEKPADIPFELPDRTEFILNRATAMAIGAVLTPDVLLRATEVIR